MCMCAERCMWTITVLSYGKGARKLLRQVPICPTRRESSEDWALAKRLCTSPGGLRENVGRCPITEETRSRPASWTKLERAMRLFQQACRQAPDGNTTFAIQPTCFGRNRGQLHNELQFRAQTTERLGAQLEAALIGVGVITVAATGANSAKSAQLANASATRLCRARRLARPCRGASLQTGVHSRSGGLSSTHCKPWQLRSFTPRLFFVPKRIRASVEAATSAPTSQQSLKGYGTRGSGFGRGDVQSPPAYRMHHSTATTWRRDHGLNGLASIDVSGCALIVLLVPSLKMFCLRRAEKS